MSAAKRFFSSTRNVKFQTKGFNWFPLNKYPQTNTISQKKWAPTSGDSFRSFAEYRLKAVNQSPLAIRTKSTSTAKPEVKST